MYKRIIREVEYAKTCASAREMLYQTYGKITLSRELELITLDEFMELNRLCVREGINNPMYF